MDPLEQLTTAVLKAPKYRHLAPDLVRRIGLEELQKRRSLKEAIKATKNKLHQVGGAYFDQKIDYERALERLRNTAVSRQTCRELMQLHASTRERLPILDAFYGTIFNELPPINSILDVASGLNPLAIPWMNLAEDTRYTAVDIYKDMISFLNGYFELLPLDGTARCQDIMSNPPTEPVDLALILKTLPVLEQVDKTAVSQLLDKINARYLLISFPLQSLGGRKKGMKAHYEAQFEQWVDGRDWHVKPFLFESELVYICKPNTAF